MDVNEWKGKFKERWNERRKYVIFEGNNGMIYPMTPAPQYSTSQKPMPSVSLPTDASHEHRHPFSEDIEILTKNVGLTIASLLAFIIISYIIVWRCRHRLNNERKRKSLRSSLQREDAYNIYAEIEPLTKNDNESPRKISKMIPLPTKMQTRSSGLRYVSDQIFRLLGTNSGRCKTNESILFSKQSHSVHFPPLPPVPDLSSGDHKRRAEHRKVSSAPCWQMDWQVSSISTDVLVDICERKNVYNPLMREADPAPYDHLKLGKAESAAQMTDEGTPVLPHDYFVLEKEKGGIPQHEEKGSHPYLILDNEEDNLDKDDKSIPTELGADEGDCTTKSEGDEGDCTTKSEGDEGGCTKSEGDEGDCTTKSEGDEGDCTTKSEGDEGDCTTKSTTIPYICPEVKSEIDKVHTYFVLESAVCLDHVKGSNTLFKNNLEQSSENSSSQHHMNTESSRAIFEISKNILSLDDNENNADAKIISTR